MARQTKQEKQTQAAIEAAFSKHGNCRQFNIMDLGKITGAGKAAAGAGQDIEAAVKAACDQYEQKPAA